MSNENTQEPVQTQSQLQPQENIQLDVPEPPPPADVGDNDYMTYTALSRKGSIFIFDSKNETE
uniref:Uncharacterized protein n=1 Tax=Candidatus Kentrum sp. FW TaxID=2126338 RepID=A0A450TIT3_9GAMM|nr:MAG: hypothetical protein BECKFW1821C_GA0114237_101128 [Candidatus Kentron sp. FW]